MPKPIQISVSTYEGAYEKAEVIALCDDGSIWSLYHEKHFDRDHWVRLPDIPTEAPDSFRDGEQIPLRM